MQKSLNIDALESLREYLASIRRSHVATMNHYASNDGRGFWHQPSKREIASLSSTATCVSSLVRARLWEAPAKQWGEAKVVVSRLLGRPWKSAGLDENNPFSLSFIAEGVLDLIEAKHYLGWEADHAVVTGEIGQLLVKAVSDATGRFAVSGAVSIDPYPPSAYLTQLAFRVLKRCLAERQSELAPITTAIRAWARTEINRQIALITTKSRIADPLQLAYAIILAATASVDEQTSPEEKALLNAALKLFFAQQHDDGMWQPSQPLFHYPAVGNAQCFEYELLTQLLYCEPLKDHLLDYLPNLELTARRLSQTSFDLGISKGSGRGVGWASGHHPQIEGPESWSTASVYDFVHSLGRLVAEAVRRALFAELKNVYSPPLRGPQPSAADFAPGFLDARLNIDGREESLKATLRDRFVLPISEEKLRIVNGGQLRRTTPMSAILFGPPGTSKTQLAKLISQFLGWPLLSVDPSYLIQDGMDHLYTRANRLFAMLAMAEEIVVLLDEFDEMGRNRSNNTDLLSRFMTTAMLPKLAAINDERKIVFLLATNYVEKFDTAFSRGGRFDMIIQVMPPSKDEKLNRADWGSVLKPALAALTGRQKTDAEKTLDELTFLETEQLVARLSSPSEASEEFADAGAKSTMGRKEEEKTWRDKCKDDQMLMRIPNPARGTPTKTALPPVAKPRTKVRSRSKTSVMPT